MSENIEVLYSENRKFPPPEDFKALSKISKDIYERASANTQEFWANEARKLHWHKPFTQILDWSNPPFARWFYDGEINVSYNCLDKHVIAGNGDRVAFHWEGEPGDTRTVTYNELLSEVSQAANLLSSLGVSEGDRVAIYMPVIPEAVVAMLACARIGAIHSVVFGGFSAESLKSRINDAEAKLVITADGTYRKGRVFPLKPIVDEAVTSTPSVERVLVVKRAGNEIGWVSGRDLWWQEEIAAMDTTHTAKGFPAEQPLYILYTSGTTGTPKGILHTTGGYLTQVATTHRTVFDLKPDSDIFWCTADIGWVTGHSYVVYGPLTNGTTQLLYEGTPDTPHQGRWWELIEKYGVTILYTAPTAIRTFMKLGRQIPAQFDLQSLRLLGSVGEPINPEAWLWYRDVIGAGKTPIVDTWWQTETGAIMVSPIPALIAAKPGSAQIPFPGISMDVVDETGASVGKNQGGLLVAREPWPSMLRGIWRNPERFQEAYWSMFGDKYFAGDGAKFDEDGDIWLLGRVDDVLNVSGHRLSTTEIESSLVAHDFVAEAAVVGASDDTTGQAVVAFVILKNRHEHELTEANITQELKAHVAKLIGGIARPRDIYLVDELPKTRSGKIMRRLLRDVAEGRALGDTTTLADAMTMSRVEAKVKGK